MMRAVAIACMLVACGGGDRAPPPPPGPGDSGASDAVLDTAEEDARPSDAKVSVPPRNVGGGGVFGRTFGGTGNQGASAIAIAGTRVVIGGGFTQTLDLGAGPLVTAGGATIDGFISVHTLDGNAVLSKPFAGNELETVLDVGIDGAGRIIVLGLFTSSITLGSDTWTVAAGAHGLFLASLSPEGTVSWSRRITSPDPLSAHLAVDEAGGIVVAIRFTTSIDVAGTTSATTANDEGVLAKWSATGELLLTKPLRASSRLTLSSLAVDRATGRIAVAGDYQGDVDFGGGTLPPIAAFTKVFVAVFDGDGQHVWSARVADTEFVLGPSGLALAPDGDVALGGRFYRRVAIRGIALESRGEDDGWLARLAPGGAPRWVRAFGGGRTDGASRVAVDGEHVVMSALFAESTDFGGGVVAALPATGSASRSVALVKHDQDGHRFSRRITGEPQTADLGAAIAIDPSRRTWATGTCRTQLDLDDGPVACDPSGDVFLLRIDP